MAKSGSQNSRKKRDKRRILMKQASPARYWETLDVSGWFETSSEGEQDNLDVFYPDEKKHLPPVYKDTLPGEHYFSWYAHEHPEKEDETAAVRLVREWYACTGDHSAEQTDPDCRKPLLGELQALAEKGCVTASCFLGHIFNDAVCVRKNTVKAKQYLQYAADSSDPYACYLLWTLLPEDEGSALLKKSAEYGCPAAVQHLCYLIYLDGFEVTGSELDSMADHLAAFASKGSWKCLEVLLNFLGSSSGKHLESEYAPAMLRLLQDLADAGYPEAVRYQGLAFMKGTLYPRNMEKAVQVLGRARRLGSDGAPALYATSLLYQSNDKSLPAATRESRLKEAREVLEEQCSRRDDDHISAGLLGCVLVKSENDEDFAKGIQCLEKNVSQEIMDIPLKAVRYILGLTDNKERHKAAVKLLNSMVRRKDRDALFLRGRYYLMGGVQKQQDQEKGLKLLHQAVGLGLQEACLLLGEIYLFGLFHVAQDTDKALEMLQDGIDLGCDRCNVLYALLDLDEISAWDEAPDEDDLLNACQRLREHYTRADDYMVIAYSLVMAGADNAFSRHDLNGEFLSDSPAGIEQIANALAEHCIRCMVACNLGPLVYMEEALEKIARTKYAPLYAGMFAKKMAFLQGFSCERICSYLTDFIWDAPESLESFRCGHGKEYRDKYGPAV